MRLAFEEPRLKVVGIGDTVREGSTGLGDLVVELAGKIWTEESSRREEPAGAVA